MRRWITVVSSALAAWKLAPYARKSVEKWKNTEEENKDGSRKKGSASKKKSTKSSSEKSTGTKTGSKSGAKKAGTTVEGKKKQAASAVKKKSGTGKKSTAKKDTYKGTGKTQKKSGKKADTKKSSPDEESFVQTSLLEGEAEAEGTPPAGEGRRIDAEETEEAPQETSGKNAEDGKSTEKDEQKQEAESKETSDSSETKDSKKEKDEETPEKLGPVFYNINEASAEDLENVPSIGADLAARIVEDRKENGRFKSVDDLGRVRGIGQRKLTQISRFVEA